MVGLPFLEMWTFEILLSKGFQLRRSCSFGCLVSEALILDFLRIYFLENLKLLEVGPLLIGIEDWNLDSVIFRWLDSLDIGHSGSNRLEYSLFWVENLRSWSFDVRIVGTLKSWDMILQVDDLLMSKDSGDIAFLRVDFDDRVSFGRFGSWDGRDFEGGIFDNCTFETWGSWGDISRGWWSSRDVGVLSISFLTTILTTVEWSFESGFFNVQSSRGFCLVVETIFVTSDFELLSFRIHRSFYHKLSSFVNGLET